MRYIDSEINGVVSKKKEKHFLRNVFNNKLFMCHLYYYTFYLLYNYKENILKLKYRIGSSFFFSSFLS